MLTRWAVQVIKHIRSVITLVHGWLSHPTVAYDQYPEATGTTLLQARRRRRGSSGSGSGAADMALVSV